MKVGIKWVLEREHWWYRSYAQSSGHYNNIVYLCNTFLDG